MSENRQKILTPERVQRILQHICEAKIPVVLRVGGNGGVAIRARASDINFGGSAQAFVDFTGISIPGMSMIRTGIGVQVEFVTMATKVMFVAAVLEKGQDNIHLAMPTALVSMERRQNERLNCREDLSAFIRLSIWEPQIDDSTAPPYYLHHTASAPLISLADVSSGGVCAITRFPALCSVLPRGVKDGAAKLILPMQEPLTVSIEVRWIKRIKEHLQQTQTAGQASLYSRTYRFGLLFTEQSEPLRLGLKQFMQQLALKEAI